MVSPTSLEESARYVRLALPLMSKYGIPMTPANYTIWYEYVAGKNEELRKTVDAIIELGKPFSEEQNASLHRRFGAAGDEKTLRQIRQDLRQILTTVFKEAGALSGQAEKYEALVSKSVDRLAPDATMHDIRNVIGEIIADTKSMAKSGKAVQQRLKKATEELDVLRKELEQTKVEAAIDFLTGVPNRKAFDDQLARFMEESASGTNPLSFLMIDVDHFKRFNDEYGHLVGDEVLQFVADKLKELVKGRDFVARYGGEEFAVILPQTPLAGAKTLAENIRAWFAQGKLRRKLTSQPLGTVTVSVGVAQYRPGESAQDFIGRADHALYFAKQHGRNRVGTESEA